MQNKLEEILVAVSFVCVERLGDGVRGGGKECELLG